MATLDGYDVVGIIGTAEHAQRLVENLAVVAQLDGEHHKRAAMYVPALSDPRHLQTVVDLLGSQYLRIDELVNPQFLIELPNVVFYIFSVVDLRHRLFSFQGMGDDATVDVLALVGCDGDEQVGVGCAGFF